MKQQRFAITGVGVVSSIGNSYESFSKNLADGKTGLKNLTRFEADPYSTSKSFEIEDFVLEGKKKQELLRLTKPAQYAIEASKQALLSSGYPIERNPYDVGIVFGGSFFDFGLITQYLRDVIGSELKSYRPLKFPNTVPNATSAQVAIELKLQGPNISLMNKQNGAFSALECAMNMVSAGRAKMMLVCGAEYLAHEMHLYFQQMDRIAGKNGREAHVPFAKDRNGFILGEGCGVLAIERLEDAEARGANILAKISASQTMWYPCNVLDFVSGENERIDRFYSSLLETATVEANNIDGFLSTANSTSDIDAWEDKLIADNLGTDVPVSAFSSYIGEVSGGCMLHLIAGCWCLEHNRVFPVAGYEGNDQLRSNVISEEAVFDELKNLIVSRAGMGGSYSAAVLSK